MGGQVVANLAAAACSIVTADSALKLVVPHPTSAPSCMAASGCEQRHAPAASCSNVSAVQPRPSSIRAPVTQLMRPGGMPAAAKHWIMSRPATEPCSRKGITPDETEWNTTAVQAAWKHWIVSRLATEPCSSLPSGEGRAARPAALLR